MDPARALRDTEENEWPPVKDDVNELKILDVHFINVLGYDDKILGFDRECTLIVVPNESRFIEGLKLALAMYKPEHVLTDPARWGSTAILFEVVGWTKSDEKVMYEWQFIRHFTPDGTEKYQMTTERGVIEDTNEETFRGRLKEFGIDPWIMVPRGFFTNAANEIEERMLSLLTSNLKFIIGDLLLEGVPLPLQMLFLEASAMAWDNHLKKQIIVTSIEDNDAWYDVYGMVFDSEFEKVV